jgi:hypothetical protein
MRLVKWVRAGGALAVLALAIPASASAVPSVTGVEAKLDTPGITFGTDPTGASLTSQVRNAVSIDGYAFEYAEDNGVRGGGIVNYAVLPTAYRADARPLDKLTYPAAQTDVQAHATCANVPALSDNGNILAWQGSDPYYDYIPWQRTSAGLGDDPARWLGLVKTATGVDLATAADLRAECVRLGGTYQRADTQTAIATALIANAVAPLNTQITTLRAQVATLTRARATSDQRAADATAARRLAEEAYQSFFIRPIDLTLAAKRFAPTAGVVLITGSATDPVLVTVTVSRRLKRKLGLSSRTLVEINGEISAEGAELLTLKPEKAIVDKLNAHRGLIPVTVLAVSGGTQDSARASIKPIPAPVVKKATRRVAAKKK